MNATACREIALLKYGSPETQGWGPRLRARFDYYTPDEVYEATVGSLVGPSTRWLDVGCGRNVFPDNLPLARLLSERCAELVGVDPDETIAENPFVHRKVQCAIEDYRPDLRFDLVTLRMVAEHVSDPASCVASLSRLVGSGGRLVIYTPFKWAPLSIASRLTPVSVHDVVKKYLWGTETKDTFPVCYRMNDRRSLRNALEQAGFVETSFEYLDDCRTLARFRFGHLCELRVRQWLSMVGLPYPESCLLAVFQRTPDE